MRINPLASYLKELLVEPADSNPGKRNGNHSSMTRRVILLTDGDHNEGGSPAKIAKRLKNAGVIIECIGIAGQSSEVNETLLKKIASLDEQGNPRYCFIGDTANLIKQYKKMSYHIKAI